MLTHTLNRMKRAPLPMLGVLLFAGILAAVLCGLHASNEKERQSYDEVYHTIPVTLTVTNLQGTSRDNLRMPAWVAEVFTDKYMLGSLYHYASDLRLKSTLSTSTLNGRAAQLKVIGLTSAEIVPALTKEGGGIVQWRDGYDEGSLSSEEALCIIPDGFLAAQNLPEDTSAITCTFQRIEHPLSIDAEPIIYTYEQIFTIAGTYVSRDNDVLYCPYAAVAAAYAGLQQEVVIDALSATLSSNELLDALRTDMSAWFAVPSATGEMTQWDTTMYYNSYPYALDINDSILERTTTTLENSLLVNNICTVLIFVIAACAGFFLGFLIVRQRGKEIALMRTMGTPNPAIYTGFVVEQMLSVTLGAFIGGAYFLWQPLERLLLFIGVYFVGLTAALVIFLNKNLMTTIKEDE
ncbi:MAG: hypothetical protein IJ438_14000 [Clostridia bacterium]|nr:hypothetical protein [Clostridia bacterium]